MNTRLEQKLPATIDKILKLLKDVLDNEYAEVHRIWNLPSMSPNIWTNYLTLFDDTVFPEVILLKKARKALKGKYSAFFKTKKGKT